MRQVHSFARSGTSSSLRTARLNLNVKTKDGDRHEVDSILSVPDSEGTQGTR